MSDLENEVRGHIYAVLDETSSIDDFESWFVGRTWDERPPFVVAVDHLLAEKHVLSPTQLTRDLADLVATIRRIEVRQMILTATATAAVIFERMHVGGSETIKRQILAGT